MTTPLLKRYRTAACKVEATPGTAESLSGTDGAINTYELLIQPGIPVDPREASGSFDNLSAVPGARMGTATFKTDFSWDGTSTLPPWLVTLLSACGYVNSTGTITPRSEAPGSNVKTLTIASYQGGRRKMIAGAAGTFKINGEAGKMVTFEWTFTGKWLAPTDTAIITPTYPTPLPVRFANSAISYNSVALTCQTFTFDAGNTVKLREDANDITGYQAAVITGRAPKVNCNPEAVLVATQDRFGQWLSANESSLTFTLAGPTNSTCVFTMAKAQIINMQEGDREGVEVETIDFQANKNSTNKDQDVSFVFTAAS